MICDLLFAFPDSYAVWEADGEQEQAARSDGTVKPLVIMQRKCYLKYTACGGFYLNTMFMSQHITDSGRHSFFSKEKRSIFHWNDL